MKVTNIVASSGNTFDYGISRIRILNDINNHIQSVVKSSLESIDRCLESYILKPIKLYMMSEDTISYSCDVIYNIDGVEYPDICIVQYSKASAGWVMSAILPTNFAIGIFKQEPED